MSDGRMSSQPKQARTVESKVHHVIPMPIWRVLVVWIAIMGAEFVHGILRMLLLAPYVGHLRSRQIGVFTGSFVILAIVCLLIRWVRAKNAGQLMIRGGI